VVSFAEFGIDEDAKNHTLDRIKMIWNQKNSELFLIDYRDALGG
jgi:hypothetical protein